MSKRDATARPSPADAGTLVLLPAREYGEILRERLPFSRHFGERGLADLTALRDRRRRAVLITAEPIDPWLVDRALEDLCKADVEVGGDMRRRLMCVVVRPQGTQPLADAVLANPAALTQLRAALGATASALLVNFAASDACDRLAQELGIAVEEGPAHQAARWGAKAGGKRLFREAGVLCTRGDPQVLRSGAEVMQAARQLAAADPALERIMVKLDAATSSAGAGNAVIRVDAIDDDADLWDVVESMRQPRDTYARDLARDGAIVEEFLPAIASSPSAQGYIGPDGAFELLAIHDQILASGAYGGCTFPVEPAVAAAVGEAMARIGPQLAGHGVRGSFGVDFAHASGRTYAIEINVRKLGPSHVIKAVRALAKGEAGGAGIVDMPGAYVHRRLHHPEVLTALTPRTAFEALSDARLLYDPRTGTGALLHIPGALRRFGYVESTALAPDAAAARSLDEQVEATLVAAAYQAGAASGSATS